MPTSTIVHLAPDKVARITGGCSLAFILASALASTPGHVGLDTARRSPRRLLRMLGCAVWVLSAHPDGRWFPCSQRPEQPLLALPYPGPA
jgi:hypothetical protein